MKFAPLLLAALAAPALAQDAPPADAPEAPPAETPPAEAPPAAPMVVVAVPPPVVAPSPLAKLPVSLLLDLAIYAQGRYTVTEAANLSEIRLDRGEVGARLGMGEHVAATLRLEAIRSAADGGALGIDGDSTVIRVRQAHVGGAWQQGKLVLGGALGVVPDPWITSLEDGYTLRPLSRTGSERLLGWQPADLAAMVRVGYGPARLSVTFGNGEGLRYPERNDGKTTTAVAEVDVIATDTIKARIAAVGRDGSLGVARVRDRRVGGGAFIATPWARGGVEAVRAWGIGDRGDAEGLELAAWAEGRIIPGLYASARVATLGYIDDGRASSFGGGVAVEPWATPTSRMRVWLAVDRITTSGAAMPLPGADGGDATVLMLVASATAPFVLD